jgi:hypothetical protein
MLPTPDERSQWIDSLFTLQPKQRWGIYLAEGMGDAGLGNSELVDRACTIKPKIFQRSNVTHWRNGVSTAEPGRVIVIAQVLGLDAIEALRIAGHDDVADFAEKVRANPVAALVEQELADIEDDPYLDHLDRLASRGHIPREERDRRRAVYLEDKRRDIETIIPEAYAAEVERIRDERDEPNGSPARAAR